MRVCVTMRLSGDGEDNVRDRPGTWRYAIGASLMALTWSMPARAADPAPGKLPEIEYASPDQSVWTTRLNDKGEPDNPLLQVAEMLFSRTGIPWRAKSYPASRLFVYLQNGTAQFSMLVRAPALAECCLFSRKPVAVAEIRVYRRAGTEPVKTREGLVGKSVIAIRGYSYGGLLNFITDEKQRIASHFTQGHASAFRMLAGGRADYLIDYAAPAGEAMQAEGIEGVESELLSQQEVFLVLSRQYPDAVNVMTRLESVLETIDVNELLRRSR